LEYYAAHLPFYPALVAAGDIFLPGPMVMLGMTLLGTIAAVVMFYLYLVKFKLSQDPLFLSFVFLFLPARFLAVRSIGSPEPWFIFFILATLYFYRQKKYLLAGLAGALAQWTKSPAILLFAGLGLYHLATNFSPRLSQFWTKTLADLRRLWPLLLIPASIIPLFLLYQLRTADFWAYFHSGDNFHLFWPPFSIFSPQGQFWVGEFWLEDIIYIWLVFGWGIIKLWRKNLKPEAFFAGIFYTSTLFVAHRDISRYILPIAPFILISLDKIITQSSVKKLLYLLLIPIYLYTWNFLLHNTAPVADWTPYL